MCLNYIKYYTVKKTKQVTNVGEEVGRKEPSYAAGGNVS
jgi:hypothetical protein